MGFFDFLSRGGDDREASPDYSWSNNNGNTAETETTRQRYTIPASEKMSPYFRLGDLRREQERIMALVENRPGTLNPQEMDRGMRIPEEIQQQAEYYRLKMRQDLEVFNAKFLDNEKVFVANQDEREMKSGKIEGGTEWRVQTPQKRNIDQAALQRDRALGGPVGAVYTEAKKFDGPLLQRTKYESDGETISENTDIVYVTFGDSPDLKEKSISTDRVDENGDVVREVTIIDYAQTDQGVIESSRNRFTGKNNEAFRLENIQRAEAATEQDQTNLEKIRESLKE